MKYWIRFIGFTCVIVCILSFIGCTSQSDIKNPNMILVEGGTFKMGDFIDNGEGDEDEKPVHEVAIDSYYISKYEVMVGEFREFVEATGYKTTSELDGGAKIFTGEAMVDDSTAYWDNVNFPQDENHPVVCVSWFDAVEYCNWRSEKEGLEKCYSGKGDNIDCDFKANGYRLPTEAEYEFAARDRGKDYKYTWGNGDPIVNGRKATNIRDETTLRRWGEKHVKTYWKGYDDSCLFTAPVGSFAANELGIHDMSGNVYEWCWDWYNEKYYENSPTSNPTGADSGTMRSCRDVGYGCLLKSVRTVNRGKCKPDYRFLHGGFRLAQSK